MPNYARGVAFERKVCDLFRSVGYYAIRSAGSHGLADVVAFNQDRLYVVQCKTGKAGLSNDECNELVTCGIVYGAQPVLATKDERGGVKLEYLGDKHFPRGRKRKPGVDITHVLEGGRGDERADSSNEAGVSEVYEACAWVAGPQRHHPKFGAGAE